MSAIVVVDGDTRTPLSVEAIVLAMLAKMGTEVQAAVINGALVAQAQLDATPDATAEITTSRIARPSTNGGGLAT